MHTRTSAPRRSQRAAVAALVLSVVGGLLLPFASATAAHAVPGPEALNAPSVAWRVADATGALVGGAAFELQGPRTSSTTWWGGETNVSWSSTVSVADCTAAPCTGADLDPDPGEFQVTTIGSHRIAVGERYRVRQTASPAGFEAAPTDWVEMGRNAQWPARVHSLSDFQVTALPAVSCASNRLYAVSADGAVSAIVVGGSTASVAPFGQWAGADDVNALGASADGTLYALQRASTTSVQSVLRYTSSTGWQAIPASYAAGSSLIAGAVSPTSGRFYFGGGFLDNGVYNFRLHQFDPATGAVSRVGIITTGFIAEQNADIAFDAAGNLVLFHSPLGGTTEVSRFDVAASALNAATGQTRLASARTSVASVGSNVNGVSFDSDGSVYFGTATQLRRVDAAGGAPTTIGQLASSVDLAACAAPVTITVQKAVPARVAATDQFTLSLRQGTAGATIGTATTTGTAVGVQAARITGVTVPTSATFTIAELMASGAAADYAASWACVSGTQTIATGSGTSGTFTTPAVGGASVVCTFTNAPLVTSVVVREVVQDADGANPQPGAGWVVNAAVQAQGGTVAPAPTAQTTAAEGTARWTLRHSTASTTASITVSETQRAGYQFVSGTCTATAPSGATSTVALPSEAGAALSGVQAGSAVECTFVNRVRPTTLTLVAHVSFGGAPAAAWQLSGTGPAGALPGPSGATGVTAQVTGGTAYRLSQSGGGANYVRVGPWSCVNQRGVSVAVSQGAVTPALGDQVTCSVTNATAALVLLERVEGTTTISPTQFSLTSTPEAMGGLSAKTVAGHEVVSAANTAIVRPGHAYALSSTSDVAHLALRVERYTGAVATGGAVDHDDAALWVPADPGSITVAAGETAVYRFVATAPTPLTLPLTGGIGADAFVLGGGALLLLAAALLLIRHRMHRPEAPQT